MTTRYAYIIRHNGQAILMEPVPIGDVRKQVRGYVQQMYEAHLITQVERNALNAKCRNTINVLIEEDEDIPSRGDKPFKLGDKYYNKFGTRIPYHKTWEYKKQWLLNKEK